MNRAASGRQAFEANLNRFGLLPQVHGAQSVDHRCEQALISSRQTGRVDPIDDVAIGFHTRAAALKEDFQETVQAHLQVEVPSEHAHERY
jgi:hypothetical protein